MRAVPLSAAKREAYGLVTDVNESDYAVFSRDRAYRYALGRGTCRAGSKFVAWVMLNPSTADAFSDDNTIRRVRSFSVGMGYPAFAVVNLYAYRATDPKALRRVRDPIGPRNDEVIARTVGSASCVVLAWGSDVGPAVGRATQVRRLVEAAHDEIWCFGWTKSCEPRHPLMLPADTEIERVKR